MTSTRVCTSPQALYPLPTETSLSPSVQASRIALRARTDAETVGIDAPDVELVEKGASYALGTPRHAWGASQTDMESAYLRLEKPQTAAVPCLSEGNLSSPA